MTPTDENGTQSAGGDGADRLSARAERLDEYLDAADLAAVWFARPNSFAWLTGGANVVDRAGEVGVAAAGYLGDGEFVVVTDDVEAGRLADEELPEAVAVESFPWYRSSLSAAVADRSPAPAAADFDVPGFDTVDATELRQPLTERDVERYRRLGSEVAAAVESVCGELQPTDTEHEVGAGVRISLSAAGIEPTVCLVGGSERARRYRHFTPTEAELGDYALVSVTAERGGLFASATRTVAFDPPAWLDERHVAATRVEATALAATREAAVEDGTAADVFDSIQDAYAALGRAEEWKRHHQGGAAGYAGREWIATPTLSRPVHAPMAYAWNPTVAGAKSEDTVLVTADGFEVLTETGRWPTRSAEAVGRDVTVDRHDVLVAE
jgi:Xaa-Pro aminopeptidase